MVRVIAKSIREYKKTSIITPILITMEVVLECIIPFLTAGLVNQVKAGAKLADLGEIRTFAGTYGRFVSDVRCTCRCNLCDCILRAGA